jgi:HSP20 family protein
MEIPGVDKNAVEVHLENDTLRIEGRIDYGSYEGLEPLYAGYNVGHFARAFTLSNKIDQGEINAQLSEGVLTLTLKKTKEATPRRIAIN